ncbi:hypothetical protein [Streptomyces sp. NPDC004629]|uniref:hypothetical protein n=1 Tax=Streptomyces sp. NPDC004629 TaxID=3364705 RepID=UPI0036BC1B85
MSWSRTAFVEQVPDLSERSAQLVRHQRGHLLREWIRQAEQDAPKPMKGFAGRDSNAC